MKETSYSMALYGRMIQDGTDRVFVYHGDQKMVTDENHRLDDAMAAWEKSGDKKKGRSLEWYLSRLGYGIAWEWGGEIVVNPLPQQTEQEE